MQVDEIAILRKQVGLQAERIANLEWENMRQQAITAVLVEQLEEYQKEQPETTDD